jgi:hypothetical protein
MSSRLSAVSILSFGFLLPSFVLAQQAAPLVERFKVEIPALRAAAEPKIGVLLKDHMAGSKSDTSLRDALTRIGKDCRTCIITVIDEPPAITPNTGAIRPKKFDFALIAAESAGTVEKAEDCPVAKPFYIASKKRCYKLEDFLVALRAPDSK